jgi:dipeptidyl aminopeptidase/acylaminoacyl peptidase
LTENLKLPVSSFKFPIAIGPAKGGLPVIAHIRIASAILFAALALNCSPQTKERQPYTAADLAGVVNIFEVAISPGGDEIAYVSDRSGAFELWTAGRAGGGWQSRQRTDLKEVVSGLTYGPDSGIVFCVDHGGDERNDLWILRRNAAAPEPMARTSLAEQSPRFSPDGRMLAYVADPDRPFCFNLMVRELAGGTIRQLTNETDNVREPRWSRDGSTIIATVTPDDQKGDLLVVDVRSKEKRRIHPPRPDGLLMPVDFMPDGLLLALATNAQGFMQLATVDIRTAKTEFVGPSDWDVEHAAVASRSGAVLASRNVRGESEVLLFTGDWSQPEIVHKGGVVAGLAINPEGNARALVGENSTHSAGVNLFGGGSAECVVAPGMGAVDGTRLANATRESVKSFDGREIDLFIWKPIAQRLGSPAPAVVVVHGGPNGQERAEFFPQEQSLAEAGFVVLGPNYRGSTGYGREFEDLNNRDWGGGDLKDLVTIVEQYAKRGIIDGSRVGIMGGSYGGYMTLRAITAAPQIWAAAVEMYGMPDLVEDFRITKDRFGSWYATEMGTPETQPVLFRDRSPINSLERVRAPLMVLQGENDSNVPRAESDLVVAALKKRGTLVEYKVYPNEGHGFTHRENRLDAMNRVVAFFRKHLGNSKRRSNSGDAPR